MAILQCLESRTQIKTRPAGKGHSKIGVPVRIDRQLRDLDFLLSKHSLNGSADLPFIEHYGLQGKIRRFLGLSLDYVKWLRHELNVRH